MGDAPNAAQTLLDQLRSSLDGASYSTSAVYASLAIAFGGAAVITALVFLLWHGLRDIYAAKELLAARLAAIAGKTKQVALPRLRQCLRICWASSEDDVLEEAGLDSVVYIRALRMMRNIFAVLTLLLFGTAAPINIYYNLHSPVGSKLTHKDALLLITPSLLSRTQMIPHVVLGWVANFVVFAIVWVNYRRVLCLRQAALADPRVQSRIESRTVLLMDLPKSARSLEGVARVARAINPQVAPTGITLGRSSKNLRHMLAEHECSVRSYERSIADGAVTVHQADLRAKYETLERDIELERVSTAGPPQGFAFLSYPTQLDAHETVQRSRNAADGIKVSLAPPADQIIWSNLGLGSTERGTKQMWVNTLYGVLLLLWILPNAFIGCFISNLSRLAAVWPAFGRSMASNKVGFAILQGFLAPTITTMVFSVLPFLFRKLSFLQGKVTRTDREHEVLRKLYAFFFLDNFFVFSIMGVVWDIVAQVLSVTNNAKSQGQHLNFSTVWHRLRIAQRIATAIVNISSFWVMYLIRAVLAEFASSSQPISLLRRLGQLLNFVRKPTPLQKAEATMPQPFQYAVNFLAILFHTTIALGFTTIQPLVLPICFLLYLLAIPIKKYELLHMQITKYESNGLFWPLVVDTTLFALGFGNLMLLTVVWVQGGWQIAVGTAPLVLTVVFFKVWVYFKFDTHFYYVDSTKSPFDSSRERVKSDEKTESSVVEECYEDPARSARIRQPLLTFNDALFSLAEKPYYHQRQHQNPFEVQDELSGDEYNGERRGSSDSAASKTSSASGAGGASITGDDPGHIYPQPGRIYTGAGLRSIIPTRASLGAVPYTPVTPVEPDAAFGYDTESLYAYDPYSSFSAGPGHDERYDGEMLAHSSSVNELNLQQGVHAQEQAPARRFSRIPSTDQEFLIRR